MAGVVKGAVGSRNRRRPYASASDTPSSHCGRRGAPHSGVSLRPQDGRVSVPETLSGPGGQALEERGGSLGEGESPQTGGWNHCAGGFAGEWCANFGAQLRSEKWVVSPQWCTEVGRLWSVFSGGATVLVMETANVRESNHLSALRWFDLAALWTLLV